MDETAHMNENKLHYNGLHGFEASEKLTLNEIIKKLN